MTEYSLHYPFDQWPRFLSVKFLPGDTNDRRSENMEAVACGGAFEAKN